MADALQLDDDDDDEYDQLQLRRRYEVPPTRVTGPLHSQPVAAASAPVRSPLHAAAPQQARDNQDERPQGGGAPSSAALPVPQRAPAPHPRPAGAIDEIVDRVMTGAKRHRWPNLVAAPCSARCAVLAFCVVG